MFTQSSADDGLPIADKKVFGALVRNTWVVIYSIRLCVGKEYPHEILFEKRKDFNSRVLIAESDFKEIRKGRQYHSVTKNITESRCY